MSLSDDCLAHCAIDRAGKTYSIAIFSSVGGSGLGLAVYDGGAMASGSTGVEEVACCDMLSCCCSDNYVFRGMGREAVKRNKFGIL